MEEKLRVKRRRDFSPHHVLLSAAFTALEDAEDKRPSYFHYELMCITFSALALEALGNAFGSKFVSRWEDYENATPIAKLRLVCQNFGIEPDFSKEPWGTCVWLARFRNKVAHAKPEFVIEDRILTRTEYDKLRLERPASKLEQEVSLRNAKRAFDCVDTIHTLLCDNIGNGLVGNLIADSWSGQAGIYEQAIPRSQVVLGSEGTISK